MNGDIQRPEIPDYQILEVLGEGSYGVVYRALYQGTEERAIKVFKKGRVNHLNVRRELDKLKLLKEGTGVVHVLQSNFKQEPYYYVMDLHAKVENGKYKGRTLEDLCGIITDPQEAWRLLVGISKALAYVHRNGIIHCDIKPPNILLNDDQPPWAILGDFGQSRASGIESFEISGTPFYASPDQLRASTDPKNSDGYRWDVYSFGVVAFRLLTGRLPRLETRRGVLQGRADFRDLPTDTRTNLTLEELAQLIEQEREIRWPQTPVLDAVLKQIIESCLLLDPKERPATMSEVHRALSERRERLKFEELQSRAKREKFSASCGEWLTANKTPERLLRTARELEEARELLVEQGPALTAAEHEFITQSNAEAEKRIKRKLMLSRALLAITALACLGLMHFYRLAKHAETAATENATRAGIAETNAHAEAQINLVIAVRYSNANQQLLVTTQALNQAKDELSRNNGELRKKTEQLTAANVQLSNQTRIAQFATLTASNALQQRELALRNVRDADARYGISLLDQHRTSEGIDYLARALSIDPGNESVAACLYSALLYGDPPIRTAGPLAHEGFVLRKWYDPNSGGGTLFVVTTNSPGGSELKVWETATGRVISDLIETNDIIWGGLVSATNRLVTVYANACKLWDTGTTPPGFLAKLNVGGAIRDWKFNPAGESLLVVSDTFRKKQLSVGRYFLRNLAKPIEFLFSLVPTAEPAVRLSDSGSGSASDFRASQVQLFDSLNGKLIRQREIQMPVREAELSPDAQFILVHTTNSTMQLWDWDSRKPLTVAADSNASLPVTAAPLLRDENTNVYVFARLGTFRDELYSANGLPGKHPRIDDSGKKMATIDGTNAQLSWLGNSHPTAALAHSKLVYYVNFSPNGLHLLTASTDSLASEIQIWNARTNPGCWKGPIYPGHSLGDIRRLEMDWADHYLAAQSSAGGIAIWDLEKGEKPAQVVVRPESSETEVLAMKFFSGGLRWVERSEEKSDLFEWDSQSETPRKVSSMPSYFMSLAEFCPGGRKLAVSGGGTIAFWDADSGWQTNKIDVGEEVKRLRFGLEGRLLATVTVTGKVRIWNVVTGEPLSLGWEADGEVDSLAIDSSDNARWVLVAANNKVRRWESYASTDAKDAESLARIGEAIALQEHGSLSKAASTLDALTNLSRNMAALKEWLTNASSMRRVTPLSPSTYHDYFEQLLSQPETASLKLFEPVRTLDPTNANAAALLGLLEVAQACDVPGTNSVLVKDYKLLSRADEDTLRAALLAPSDPMVIWCRGTVLYCCGRIREATSCWTMACDIVGRLSSQSGGHDLRPVVNLSSRLSSQDFVYRMNGLLETNQSRDKR